MGEGKWVKTYVNSYDDTPSKMIDSREDRDTIHYVRGRLNALAGKVNRNGELYMTETKPYTIKTLAIEFNRDFEAVKEAIKVLKSLEVIEITEDRVFKITDWEMDQNVEGLERIRKQTSERVARHRAAKKAAEDNKKVQEEKKDDEVPVKSDEDVEDKDEKAEEKYTEKERECDHGENGNETKDNVQDIIVSQSNVTVTKQNKRRGKRRNKKKDKRESKRKGNDSLIEFSCDNNDFEISDDNGEDLFCESFISEESGFDDDVENGSNIVFFDVSENDKQDERFESGFEMNGAISFNEQPARNFEISNAENNVEERAKSLLKYCNDIALCIPENITVNALKYAVNAHTEKYVKMAIDRSIEIGKFNMPYINGILKNWRIEGYPREEYIGGIINGRNSYGKGNIQYTGKFEGFKPKEPRKLTEGEREIAEKNLI